MKDERMVEELAKIDGYALVERHRNGAWIGEHPERVSKCLPNYLEDANATKRIIQGMSFSLRRKYWLALCSIVKVKGERSYPLDLAIIATGRQEAEAILKAHDKREEG